MWPITREAYNVSAHFPRGGRGLTNFLHLHTPVTRLYGKRLAVEDATPWQWLQSGEAREALLPTAAVE